MDDTKFELEGQIEENDDILDEFDEEDEEYERGPGVYILLVVFIFLFLVASSLFVYYQFYLGNGKWDFSMKKRSSSAVVINEELQKENEILRIKIDSFENQATNTKTEHDEDYAQATSGSNTGSSELFHPDLGGVKYEVQIGAFQNYDFTKYNKYLVNMNVDEEDGFNKLVIGRFASFDDACAFRQDLKLIGITSSFIVKKEDGERVSFDRWCP